MTTPYNSEGTSVPTFIRHIKDMEKRNFQTMLVLLGVDVAFVAITAIVGLPFWAIFSVAGVFFAVIGFFGFRTFKFTRILKKLDAEIKKELEFQRFIHSIR